MAKTAKKKSRGSKVNPKGVHVTSARDYSDLVWFECQRQKLGARDVADKAAKLGVPVGAQTVANHMAGNVTSPQLRTVVAVLKALGFEVRVSSSK